jgi:urea carboxylase-associated protein 2
MSDAPTSTTLGARDHARSLSGTVVEAMPTVPPSAARDLPPGVDPDRVLWDEVVAGGGYTAGSLPRGARLQLTDLQGDACAGLLLHRADRPSERLNVADTVKVQWQAYLHEGQLLLSDMGRVLAAITTDTSGHHDTFCGTSNRATNAARYGDGAPDGPTPNGRDHFGVALAKLGLERRDIAPNVNLFKGVRVDPDGALHFDGDLRPGATVVLRFELPLLVSIVNVPHPLDRRPDYTVTPLRVTAWRGEPAAPDDPARAASPEAERAYRNTEQEAAR